MYTVQRSEEIDSSLVFPFPVYCSGVWYERGGKAELRQDWDSWGRLAARGDDECPSLESLQALSYLEEEQVDVGPLVP